MIGSKRTVTGYPQAYLDKMSYSGGTRYSKTYPLSAAPQPGCSAFHTWVRKRCNSSHLLATNTRRAANNNMGMCLSGRPVLSKLTCKIVETSTDGPPPSTSDNASAANVQSSSKCPKKKTQPWLRSIPFTPSWREERKARSGPEIGVAGPTKPKTEERKRTATKVAAPNKEPEIGQGKKASKILAQYAHHNGKGAVGWTPPTPTYEPYPYNKYVGGKRVLAQYSHHDDKWAVKHPVW